jgi:predicted dienelactone hydrolase
VCSSDLHLARRGYFVLGVSHFGESPVFGQDSVDPASVARFGDRTRDLNYSLDYFVSRSRYAGQVDLDRLGAIGHSSGGASVMMLGGGQFSAERLGAYCASQAAATDKGCWYPVGDRDKLETQRPVPSAHPIRALVALDPAVGPGFDDSSLRPVAAATLVIGSVQNDFLPYAYHAGRYAELLPDAEVVGLDSGEGHFVYLDECSLPTEVMGVPLCADREGVDRGEVHADLIQVIESFFSRHLMGEVPLEGS